MKLEEVSALEKTRHLRYFYFAFSFAAFILGKAAFVYTFGLLSVLLLFDCSASFLIN
jgi:hypothetical protein